ncbi:MAG TPA: glycosyltransferase family 2 protein [Candidatus Limnocylindrales bacterium]|nr:glycosyltransferase family 2 protein [Candidatus Limnocylindrales bacterium]
MSDHLIVIPVFNEAETIEAVVARARRHGPVLVVDDGSSDESAGAAARAGADVVRLGRRRGKGEALRRGFSEALARGAERVITMDGDGQHDPDDIPRLLEAAAAAPDALVIGGRLGRGPKASAPTVIPLERLNAMRVAGFFIDWLTGTALLDTQSGFRVYPARLLASVQAGGGGFVFETEMLVRAAAAGWPFVEAPVTAVHFSDRRSRFRSGPDGVAVGTYLVVQSLRRLGRELLMVVAALLRPFTPARMRVRHRELHQFTASFRDTPAVFMTAVGGFVLHRTAETWRGWWHDPRARGLRLVAAASLATPLLLVLLALRPLLHAAGVDPLTALIGRLYSQARLAATLPRPGRPRPTPIGSTSPATEPRP